MQEFKKYEINKDDVLTIAERMKKDGRRIVMIQGYINKEGQNVVCYQYALGNLIESYYVKGQAELPSISHIYDLAAAWPEEELFELMGIKFEGLQMRGRLFLSDTMLDGQGHIIVTPLSELREKATGVKGEE